MITTHASSAHPSAGNGDGLPRKLGVWSAAAAAVGLTIGSGIFRVPATVAAESGSVGAIALVWILGGVITLCGALTIAELAAAFPRAGGIYVYLREAYGPLAAFLFGWSWFFIRSAASAGTALVFVAYLGTFVPMGGLGQRLAAITLIVLVGAANYRSVRLGAAIQDASTVAKVAAILLAAAAIFALGQGGGALAQPVTFAPAGLGGIGVALVAALFAYDGWIAATLIAGEVRDPGRALPRALTWGAIVIVATYLTINVAYLYALPLAELAASKAVAVDAVTRVAGAAGAALIAALVMLSTFGGLNAGLMTGPRVYYAMAEDGLFFRRVAAVHPRFGTPHVAVVLLVVLTALNASVRTFEQLAEAFVLLLYPFLALTVAAVFVLRRRRPDLARPYRTVGYPLVPAVFLVGTLAMMVNALLERPAATLLAAGIVAIGVPIYFAWRSAARRQAAS
ncbi:APC family permease [Longimicrobium sp.]|uniref:APC family permease n=1 Tax=Longimicrobium sp. TaxID=2029185 RepID=UPI003B3BCA05